MMKPPVDQLYRFAWRNNSKRATLYGRTCIVLHRGAMNSCIVQFIDDCSKEVISRNALRKIKPMATAKEGK